MEYSVLNNIGNPSDIKKLNSDELQILCEEIRDFIITTVSQNGGHLASNLGCVELTVALHRCFNSPKDAIIFDVGHQSYTHKLLTGRFNRFSSLRTEGGISGFMRPLESEHDAFITGHSSNSVSAAYGIYKAKLLKGEEGTALAVIGDGALTGGMAYEALNNAGEAKGNFIVVLNDNKMSISENVGALSKSLTRMRSKPRYHRFKLALSNFLIRIPLIGKFLNKLVFALKESFKGVIYKHNFFTAMGFNYLGPVDGHDIGAIENLLKIAKGYNRPSLVHVITTKGKGYSYAENSPDCYHGVSSFDITEGATNNQKLNFSLIAGKALTELAAKNSKICAVTAAMTEGTGLSFFEKSFKDRFFDVGIAEQHAVTFSAGLSKEGLKPFFAVYSSFLQRGYDQLLHDVATAPFPIKLLVDRAGIVGEDGETHQGLFDISYLRSIPNMNIYSPASYRELEYRIKQTAENNEISAIRYPRGGEGKFLPFDETKDYSVIESGEKKAIVTFGRLFSEASHALAENQSFDIVKLNKIYPLKNELIERLSFYSELHIFEETVRSGGIGEYISALLVEKNYRGVLKIHSVEDKFVPSMTISSALSKLHLDKNAMLNAIGGN